MIQRLQWLPGIPYTDQSQKQDSHQWTAYKFWMDGVNRGISKRRQWKLVPTIKPQSNQLKSRKSREQIGFRCPCLIAALGRAPLYFFLFLSIYLSHSVVRSSQQKPAIASGDHRNLRNWHTSMETLCWEHGENGPQFTAQALTLSAIVTPLSLSRFIVRLTLSRFH